MITTRRLLHTSLAVVSVVAFTGLAAHADRSVTLADIITQITNVKNAIQDLTLTYTCIRRPYGSQGRDLTPAEQAKVNRLAGWYKEESGVLKQQGSRLRLDWTYYRTSDTIDQRSQSIAYDGTRTLLNISAPALRPDHRVISAGRSHRFRSWFNPILTLSATGDKTFSDELRDKDTELVHGVYNVNGVESRLVRLYQRNRKGKRVRTFKVYLDPSKSYAIQAVEKYWTDFGCLEQTMKIEAFTTVGNINIPTKALCVSYNRPRGSNTSHPIYEQEVNITDIDINQGIDNLAFEVTFKEGAKVTNAIVAPLLMSRKELLNDAEQEAIDSMWE